MTNPSIAELERRLTSRNRRVRRHAVGRLAQIPGGRAEQALLRSIREDSDLLVRTHAANALARRDPDRAAGPIVAASRLGAGNSARSGMPDATEMLESGLWGLTELRPSAVFLEALTQDGASVRMMAATMLGDRRETEAVAPLASVLLGDKNEVVREQAALALGKIGEAHAVEALVHSSRADPSRRVRRKARRALRRLKGD